MYSIDNDWLCLGSFAYWQQMLRLQGTQRHHWLCVHHGIRRKKSDIRKLHCMGQLTIQYDNRWSV